MLTGRRIKGCDRQECSCRILRLDQRQILLLVRGFGARSFPQWGSHLFCTRSAPSSDYAIVDRQLLFIEEVDNDEDKIKRAAIVERMDSKSHATLEEVRKSRLALAT